MIMKQSWLPFVVFSLCLLVLVTGANAEGLEYYGIEATINNDLTINNLMTLKFDTPINHLDYQLDFGVFDLEVKQDFDSADCSVDNTGFGSVISCDFEGITEDENRLELRFRTDREIIKRDTWYEFRANYDVSVPVKEAFILVRLPTNNVLARETANESFSPKDGEVLTDGRHIMVIWRRENLTVTDSLDFSVLYTVPAFGGPLRNLIVVGLTVIVIASMIGVAAYMKRDSREAIESKAEVVKSVLNRDEKVIVDILGRHNGRANQKVLVRESEFSKAKVSRIVKNLKGRGVVEIEPVSGRENRIVLKIKSEE